MSQHEKWMKDPEYQRLFVQEMLISDASQLIDEWLDIRNQSRSDLARKIGKNRSFVTQLLKGTRNMTLRTLADMFWALGLEIRLVAHDKVAERLQNEVVTQSSQQPLRPPATDFEMAANDFEYAEAA